MIRTRDVSAGYGKRTVLQGVSLDIRPGSFTGLIGANGSGKSTLVKAIVGRIPSTGAIEVDGCLGYMPQQADIDWDFPATLFDVALFGRIAHLPWWRWPGTKDKAAARRALERVGLADLANRPISALSGGQRQRTLLARTLAGDPDVIILDEPFAGVDAASQATIVEVLHELNAAGRTIVLVHHDLAEVAAYCSDVVLLAGGTVMASGPTQETLTDANIATLFSLPHSKRQLAHHPRGGRDD